MHRASHACFCRPDSSLPAAIAEELGVLLNKAEQLSLRMLLLAPACPLDKILSNLAAKGAEHPCTVFRARWMRTLEAMALSTEQQVLAQSAPCHCASAAVPLGVKSMPLDKGWSSV